MAWPAVLLMALYAASLILFATSMLSASTVLRTVATSACAETGVPPVDQVVMIVIDAMRPDFVLSSLRPFARAGGLCVAPEGVTGPLSSDGLYTGPTLNYMQEALRSRDSASVAFFLVADAPTTTAQRVKALATGTMPAFLEAGSNFNSEAIVIDSIVGHMHGSAVLLGDDTWTKLFPNTAMRRYWKKAVGIPSFDVADFHTNDNAVLAEMYHVLEAETPKGKAVRPLFEHGDGHARLIVAHFLGIDHIGHRLDAANPFMEGKILQLDAMLRNVSAVLHERPTSGNTMLLVLGDHGMTNHGDHGGGTAQETDTFLFAEWIPGAARQSAEEGARASEVGLNLARARALVERRWRDRVDAEFDRLRSCHAVAGVPQDRLGATYQVDVTATIAVLLGKPIPFSSFGRVISEVMALANASVDLDAVERCNLRQLQRYFKDSHMKVPRNASWTWPGRSVAQRLADMSFYARRTRTDMNPNGMLVGCTGLLLCAMSILWSPAVRAYVLPCSAAGWFMRWTAFVFLLRLCTNFSNSFVVNEDSELLGLLSSLLLMLWVPRWGKWRRRCEVTTSAFTICGRTPVQSTRQRVTVGKWLAMCWSATAKDDALFLGALLLGLRLVVPSLLHHRAHITHQVEMESTIDRLLRQLPLFLRPERLGMAVGSLSWCLLYPQRVAPLVLALTSACFALAYHIPVLHHCAPLFCIVAYPILSRLGSQPLLRYFGASRVAAVSQRAPYAYFVTVLWLSSLCSSNITAAAVVALYGVSLPRLCDVLSVEPVLTQALILHLAAFVAFFAEGHQCMLSVIDWNASLVGLPSYHMYAGGALVLCRTFNAFLLVPFALCIRASELDEDVSTVAPTPWAAEVEQCSNGDEVRRGNERGDVGPGASSGSLEVKHTRASAAVVMYAYAHIMIVQSSTACFNGFLQKSHLMLFPIFCPKLLFDGVAGLLTCVVVLAALLLTSFYPSSPLPPRALHSLKDDALRSSLGTLTEETTGDIKER